MVVAGSRGTEAIDPRDAVMGEAAMLGMSLWNNAGGGDCQRPCGPLVAYLANGTLRPVIGKGLPLKDAPEAHKAVMEPGTYGKIVLIP